MPSLMVGVLLRPGASEPFHTFFFDVSAGGDVSLVFTHGVNSVAGLEGVGPPAIRRPRQPRQPFVQRWPPVPGEVSPAFCRCGCLAPGIGGAVAGGAGGGGAGGASHPSSQRGGAGGGPRGGGASGAGGAGAGPSVQHPHRAVGLGDSPPKAISKSMAPRYEASKGCLPFESAFGFAFEGKISLWVSKLDPIGSFTAFSPINSHTPSVKHIIYNI